MLNGLKRLSAATLGAMSLAQPASAQQAPAMGQEQFVRTVDQCLTANRQTEFDTPAAVVDRIRGSCVVTATVRFPARGHPVLGDVLRYDPQRRQFVWSVQLDEQNRFYGGGASPYRQGMQLDSSGRPAAPPHSPDVRAALGDIGNAHFWLLPLFRTAQVNDSYDASNAFGASREVIRSRETRYGVAFQIPAGLFNMNVLEVPVEPERAREVADNLDVQLTFEVQPPCAVCYKASTLERGVRPTIRAPIDTEITTHFLHVRLVRFDVIDRVTGRVGYSAGPTE